MQYLSKTAFTILKILFFSTLILTFVTKASDCLSGFIDLQGGASGDSNFMGLDYSKESGRVVACGWSSSNSDFVTFDA
jgi:hypothetical protein